MDSAESPSSTAAWLVENGPKELELLFRAIVYHPSAPLLIADDDGNSRDASAGAGKLLGLPREKIIGHQINEFASARLPATGFAALARVSGAGRAGGHTPAGGPGRNPAGSGIRGQRERLARAPRSCSARQNASVTDARHSIMGAGLRAVPAGYRRTSRRVVFGRGTHLRLPGRRGHRPARIFSPSRRRYSPGRPAGRSSSGPPTKATPERKAGSDRKDGSRFWANAITLALKDGNGELQGFARVVRDFSDRHERDEKLRRSRARIRPIPSQSTIAGIVSGEFDRVPEVNDAFLELVGYTREDLLAGRLILARPHSARVCSTG